MLAPQPNALTRKTRAHCEQKEATVLLIGMKQFDTVQNLIAHALTVDDRFFDSFVARNDSVRPSSEILLTYTAFLLYTSGSTGTPKGIILEHAAISASIPG